MIMEEVTMVMEKVQETKKIKILHAVTEADTVSTTLSLWRLSSHASCVATPPSMLCKPHSS